MQLMRQASEATCSCALSAGGAFFLRGAAARAIGRWERLRSILCSCSGVKWWLDGGSMSGVIYTTRKFRVHMQACLGDKSRHVFQSTSFTFTVISMARHYRKYVTHNAEMHP